MPLSSDIKDQAITKLGDYAMKLDDACALLCFVVSDDGITVDAYCVGNAMAALGAGQFVLRGIENGLMKDYSTDDGNDRGED